ncbi:N-acetyllactosaminide beta-1,3-N-acetylglucosaminyltransferase 3-like isoform X1 [Parambassis ranga]|uniref:Hexosyltransferase n=1 Tax=Parambassis ranga TaxID=210632 RepID=A0A6P7I3M0_9TELE|nr:N-acetyllactosaminide beta-1,3-N-acetylglucosaminyltransferase 3-like isoform X1 [Parambassis ranga]
MRLKKSNILLLAVTLGFLIFFSCKELFTYHATDHVRVNVRKEEVQRTPPAKNKPILIQWPKCQQNISAAKISGFETVPKNIQDFLFYRHCRHFPMLLDLPDKCGGAENSAEVFLLLVIKSAPMNYERREVLRKTWAKERVHNRVWIRRIFITGTSGVGFEKDRLNAGLKLEQHEYNDILQWDFEESFFNLTLKQTLFLEWMDRNCPDARFHLNGDDDVFAHTDNMVEYLQGLKDNDGSKQLFTGHLITGKGPIRLAGSKYFVPIQVQESETYPSYCGGGGYLLSGYTARVIYNMSESIDIHPIDDVYMGMCLAKAGLGPSSHMGFRTAGLHIPSKKMDQYDPCHYKDILLVHRLMPVQVYFMWHKIHDPNLKCRMKKISNIKQKFL